MLPALVAAFCLLTACYDEIGKGNEITSSDGEIDFSATTAIETGSGLPQTKTQFSGTRISYNVSYTPSKKIERINWVSGDLIRIYSPQAQNAEAITYHNLRPAETNRMHVWADYKIGNSKDNLKNDTATVVTPLYVGKFPNGRDSYNGIRWNEKETEYKGKDHHFYGLYPSPRTDSDTPQQDSGGNPLPLMKDAAGNQHPLAISIDPATNVATITGFIPAVQNPVERKSQPVERINENGSTSDWTTSWTAREFIPDMYYAAMAAYCKAKEPTNWREKNIELGFKPLFTSLRLELLADADDEINVVDVTPEDDPEGLGLYPEYPEPPHQRFKLPLTKLELYKTKDGVTPDKTLAGSYQVKIGGNLSSPESPVYVDMAGNESDKITMDLGSGVYLYTHADKNKALRTAFTFLCAPGPQDHLYIRLTFSDGVETVTRTITLRTLGASDPSDPSNPVLGWITIDSMKKLYLDAVAVNKKYYFESTEPIALDRTLPTGISQLDYKDILRVKSYKRRSDGTSEKVPWDIAPGNSYYWDGSWHDTPASWLGFSANSKTGCLAGASGEPVDVLLKENNGIRNFSWGSNTSQKIAGAKNLVGLKDQATVPYENNPGMETANCYIISSPGWYKLPCLYGNVCRGGIETNNTAAYNRGNTYSAPILGPFVNHDNKKLTGSWIKQNLGNEDPDEAVLLWQDSKNLVKNLEINRRTYGGAASGQPWVYFYVDVITPGNAVIAVKKDGVVVWSWHLWFLPSDHIAEKRVDSSDGNWYNAPYGYDSMMTLNLGYAPQEAGTVPPRECKVRLRQRDSGLETIVTIVQNGVEAHPADWPFYQWGRKDPLFPVHWLDGVVQLEKTKVYDEAGNIVSFQSADPDGFSDFSIGRGIREPMKLFTDNNKSGKSWYGSNRYDNLWNVNITSSVWNTSDRDGVTYNTSGKADNSSVKKTIYDPCPPGYCVPGRNAFTGFHSDPDVPAESGHSGNGQSWPRSDRVSDSDDPNRCRHEFIEAGNVNTIRALTSETDLIKEGFNFYTDNSRTETINFPLTGRIAGNQTVDAEKNEPVSVLPGGITAEHYGAYWTAAPYYSPGEMYYARTLLFMIFQETRENYKPTHTSENFWSLFVYPVYSKNSPFDPGGFMQSHGQAVRCVKERK